MVIISSPFVTGSPIATHPDEHSRKMNDPGYEISSCETFAVPDRTKTRWPVAWCQLLLVGLMEILPYCFKERLSSRRGMYVPLKNALKAMGASTVESIGVVFVLTH